MPRSREVREVPGAEFEPKESVESRIILEFFRHGEKETDPAKENKDLMLTGKGRRQARSRGKELNPEPRVGIAFGSPKRRTQETAARVMLAERDDITDDMSLKEIEEAISRELKSKNLKKAVEDDRLDFKQKPDSQLPKLSGQALKEGRLLSFIVHESDGFAQQFGDESTYTYSRNAEQVASVIEKYLKVGESFERVIQRDPEKYKEFGNQMERYMGTHQTIGESFVAKYLEKTKGLGVRDEFLRALGEGFEELQGFRVEIVNRGGAQEAILHVQAKGKAWNIPLDKQILDEIISEGKETRKAATDTAS